MRSFNIESSLRNWAKEITNLYEWLVIRFDYNDIRNRYLVSYHYEKEIEETHPFYVEAISFEDKMNELYHENAPLFCDEESLFRLSQSAEEIRKPSYSEWFKVDFSQIVNFEEQFSAIIISNTFNNEYALAA